MQARVGPCILCVSEDARGAKAEARFRQWLAACHGSIIPSPWPRGAVAWAASPIDRVDLGGNWFASRLSVRVCSLSLCWGYISSLLAIAHVCVHVLLAIGALVSSLFGQGCPLYQKPP